MCQYLLSICCELLVKLRKLTCVFGFVCIPGQLSADGCAVAFMTENVFLAIVFGGGMVANSIDLRLLSVTNW